jgi:ketosteroid isomerase-like protein
MSARNAAEAYAAAINAADLDALVGLFAPRAVLRNPAGTFDTPETIRGFYEGVVLAGKTQLTIASLVEESETVARAELDATSPLSEPGTPPMRAIDVFTVDAEGAIVSLDITYP